MATIDLAIQEPKVNNIEELVMAMECVAKHDLSRIT